MRELIPFLGESLVELIEFRAEQQPNQIAYQYIKDKDEQLDTLTYSELETRIKRLSAQLQQSHIAGERVILAYPAGLDYIVAYFAVIFSGAIAVPVFEPRQSAHFNRLESIIIDCSPKLILTTTQTLAVTRQEMIDKVSSYGLEWVVTDALDLDAQKNQPNWQPIISKKDDIVFLQYTSGSTGSPKGVMVSNGNLIHNCSVLTETTEPDGNECMVSWLPPYHDMGLIGGLLLPLFAGYPCVIMSPVTVIQRPYKLLKAITEFGGTIAGGPNFIFDACVQRIRESQLEGIDLSRWKVAFNGAEPIHAKTIEDFSNKFSSYGFKHTTHFPCYGMAENTLIASYTPPSQEPLIRYYCKDDLQNGLATRASIPASVEADTCLVSSGRQPPGVTIKIVSAETAMECKPREVGEIWLLGNSVAHGYWRREQVPGEEFFGILEGDNTNQYLRTGDLGFLDDGELFVTGRIKDVIIVRGKNHYPQDIELTVTSCHSALKPNTAAAFSISVDCVERVVVMIEIKPNVDSATRAAILEQAKTVVSEAHELQLHDLQFIRPGTLPKTTSGKIQRRAAKAQYLSSLNQ